METLEHKDYKQLLAYELESRLRRNPRYSQRAFARDLNITPHRLSEILAGKQGLSRSAALKISTRLGMLPDEQEQFCDLVDSKHARGKVQRDSAIKRISLRSQSSKSIESLKTPYIDLSVDKFRFIADWYHMAILELARLSDFVGTAKWIGKRLGLPESQAKLALVRLEKLGLAKTTGNSFEISKDNHAVPSGVSSEAIKMFHTQLLEKSLNAVQSQGVDERISNSSILAIDSSRLPELAKKVDAFWKDVFKEFDVDVSNGTANEIYGMTIQAFRLTEKKDVPGPSTN